MSLHPSRCPCLLCRLRAALVAVEWPMSRTQALADRRHEMLALRALTGWSDEHARVVVARYAPAEGLPEWAAVSRLQRAAATGMLPRWMGAPRG
jgi:predicted ATPase